MFSSKWKELAELVGMAAILTGIYFVYAEIQQNSVIARAELSATTMQRLNEISDRLLDSEFSALYLKGRHTPTDLNETERQQLNAFFAGLISVMAFEYRNYNLGLFAEYDQVPRFVARQYLSRGYGRVWWNVVRKRMNPDIANVVDRELSKSVTSWDWNQLDAEIVDELETMR